MIDALFGSKTRVKLLQLFFNNPGHAFYVREITRKIDEQINSVRRELANMMTVGVVVSNNIDNKLYYEVNQSYEYYEPLHRIFGSNTKVTVRQASSLDWQTKLVAGLTSATAVVASGSLSGSTHTDIDLLIVGAVSAPKLRAFVKQFETFEGRMINYTTLSQQEFEYRLGVRDKFISSILASPSIILKDTANIIGRGDF